MGHHHHHDPCCPCPKKERCFKVVEKCVRIKCPKKCCPDPCCCPPVTTGVFGPGGVGFWVFLLILALLGIAWAQSAIGPPVV